MPNEPACKRKPWGLAAISVASLFAATSLVAIEQGYEAPQALASDSPQNDRTQIFDYPLVFEEPFSPIGMASQEEEDQLNRAIKSYIDGEDTEDVSAFLGLVESNPDNPWTASIWLNLGLQYRRTGYYTRALSAFEVSWNLAKTIDDPKAKMVADRAVGELARLSGSLGRYETLGPLLEEVKGREVSGTATARLEGASQGLWLMDNKPERSFRCGPMALGNVARIMGIDAEQDGLITEMTSTRQGTSLLENYELSREVGLAMQMAYRNPSAEVVIPSVVHWKSGHFAALTSEVEDTDAPPRFIAEDPTFLADVTVSIQAVDDEASGYFLVPRGELPRGWRAVELDEASRVWGRGNTTAFDGENTTSGDHSGGGNGDDDCKGMAQYKAHLALVSLNIVDVPLYYSPPRGPDINIRATYNQQEEYQSTDIPHTNLGAKWNLDYIAYIEDDSPNPTSDVYLHPSGGGRETYYYDSSISGFRHHYRSQAKLKRTSLLPVEYELTRPNGVVETYSEAIGTSPRRIYLTKIADPSGNEMSLSWSTVLTPTGQKLKLDKITDALGKDTTFQYGLSNDPVKLTSVEDPFQRSTSFTYTNGKLTDITDMAGLVSSFTYQFDFIDSLTNDDGPTTFAKGIVGANPVERWLEATDPDGNTERFEYRSDSGLTCPIGNTDPDLLCKYDFYGPPAGVADSDDGTLEHRNTFHWNKAAWAEAQLLTGQDKYKEAHVYNWLHTGDT